MSTSASVRPAHALVRPVLAVKVPQLNRVTHDIIGRAAYDRSRHGMSWAAIALKYNVDRADLQGRVEKATALSVTTLSRAYVQSADHALSLAESLQQTDSRADLPFHKAVSSTVAWARQNKLVEEAQKQLDSCKALLAQRQLEDTFARDEAIREIELQSGTEGRDELTKTLTILHLYMVFVTKRHR